ncbi:hypothetical protein BALAC2494_02045 [Bifidobacterium animalis subsp. lactis CNCM I-2494]|uniref:Uncharacterized protein n=1 Tax=Bifidobacterium animalis subsp. lactis CNCM I-2494 TaxID=1042403 RepID=A0A806FMS0_BIFAN|nr:hypothetical protein BALAC2494_02045 [Bifidobacterium animalis subsp. lactis CNCM I-2494]
MGVEHAKLGFRPCLLIQFLYHTSNDEARPLHTNLRRAGFGCRLITATASAGAATVRHWIATPL